MKQYKFDRDAFMASPNYRISDKILRIPRWILMTVATILSIVYGLMITKCSEVIKSVTEGNTDLMNVLAVYIVVNIGMAILSFFSNNALKAWRLNEINNQFLKKYNSIFDSRTQDITAVGPAKIESTVNQIACYKSDIKTQVIGIIEVIVPFAVTMWKVMEQNLIAGFSMLLLMGVTLFLSINGDNLFHFNENASQMKGEMRSVSVNNFVVVRMLKYMGAKEYATYRQRRAQDEATPAFLNVSRKFYDAFMAVLYNSPILIALGVAAFANDIGLAIFVAMNEWTIRSMIGYVSSITETKSEIDGLEKVLETLKGDDTSIDEKPTMPEKMILKDVEFYYVSDKEHRTPFKIPYFEIERGKRYRISGPSSAGKSTFFKYFAGEMEANKSFDVRTFYIHQRSELVYGTLRENITLGNKWVPDPVIEDLLRSVKLDHFMDTLPNGLDTIIGKDIEPSGGEQSRISLLRLFVHLRNYGPNGSNPITNEVIILDEVTSALDKRDVFIGENDLSTEEAVIKVIDKETKGSTMFVISHEDVSSNAFGFKDIVDEQMIIDICGNDRILKKMSDNRKIDVTHQWGKLHKIM